MSPRVQRGALALDKRRWRDIGGKVRVLFVEDSEDDAFFILRELEQAGLELTHARVLSEATLREALINNDWDVVISDYAMPSFNGLVAARLVRQHDPDLPFIFVSGAIGEDRAIEAMRAGVRDYLCKDNLARLPAVVLREVENAQAKRRAQLEVAQAYRYGEEVVERLRFPIAIVDRSLNIVTANPAFERMFDAHRHDEALSFPEWIGATDHEQKELVRLFRTAFTGGSSDQAREVNTFIQGRVREFLLHVQQLPLGNGATAHLLVSLQDLTELKLLERKVTAAQRMEAIGLLAGGVAHDFNNILTVIESYTYFLSDAMGDDEGNQNDLKMIQQAAARATRLTQQLLTFSRKKPQDLRPVNVNEVVEGVVGLLRRVLGEHILLQTVLSPEVFVINANVTQLEQVVMNLAVNARDAMHQGGQLILETGVAELDETYAAQKGVELSEERKFVTLQVSDTGVGMDEATRLRVFEPFFTTKGPELGTGLGLATVYGIVKQFGGYVWIYSELGLGTTIKIYLPIPDQEAKLSGRPVDSLEPPKGSGTILLVEDDQNVRRAASRILRAAGYTVHEAVDGQDGLDAVSRGDLVDLVLTDVVMPNMTGGNMGRVISEQDPDIPIVYMSGYADSMIQQIEVLPEGVPYLQKPFSRRSLLAAVSAGLACTGRKAAEPKADKLG